MEKTGRRLADAAQARQLSASEWIDGCAARVGTHLERTLFALHWMQNVELRRRVQIGLNKGEAKNSLARTVFLNRLGQLRDRSFENQRYRASGLNLVVAAIVLWNTVYLKRAVRVYRTRVRTWTTSFCHTCRRWAGELHRPV